MTQGGDGARTLGISTWRYPYVRQSQPGADECPCAHRSTSAVVRHKESKNHRAERITLVPKTMTTTSTPRKDCESCWNRTGRGCTFRPHTYPLQQHWVSSPTSPSRPISPSQQLPPWPSQPCAPPAPALLHRSHPNRGRCARPHQSSSFPVASRHPRGPVAYRRSCSRPRRRRFQYYSPHCCCRPRAGVFSSGGGSGVEPRS